MFLLVLITILHLSTQEQDEVTIQYLYKPKECKDMAKHGDTMHVQYLGRFYESRVKFDSSYDRNNVPFNYKLGIGGVIEGYQIGTQNMCINERRRLIVPSKYAYGAGGTTGIPGYSTLMFDVHLVQINDEKPSYPTPDPEEELVIVDRLNDVQCDEQIKKGDTVTLDYAGSLADGTAFDNGTGLQFVVGASQVIPGIDEAVVGLCLSTSAALRIPPVKAWNDRWEGPVPQWSHVHYTINVTDHKARTESAKKKELSFESVSKPTECIYTIQAGDYILLKYTVYSTSGAELGSGEMRYPVGRRVLAAGWDRVLEGMCIGEVRTAYIPADLAHKVGTSLFLAPPQTAFNCRLEVVKLLLSHDDKDEIDVRVGVLEGVKASSMHVEL